CNEEHPGKETYCSAQPAEKFPCGLVHRMLQDFLSSRLEAMDYSAPSCGGLVKALSEEVKALVRTVCPDRYRLVCTVALGQLGPEGQQGYGGLVLASRSLWDPHTDTFMVFCERVCVCVCGCLYYYLRGYQKSPHR
uniref:Uncharacterized protein n=1 Tax=Oncorhynchus kisutch TaxID=8019 RepID=A0A8C7FF27_ONCKI